MQPTFAHNFSDATRAARQTAELVSALTTALRAAFPEVPTRRPRRLPHYEPLPTATTDDEEEPLSRRFDLSQEHPGRYRAHLTSSDSEESDTDYVRDTDRRSHHHPRHVRPHREPTGTRGQRLFTTTDPPTRRDFRNALLFVDRASRSSKYFGTRDVVEIQLLQEFLHPRIVPADPRPEAEEEAKRPEAAEAALPSRTGTPTPPPSELFPPLLRTSSPPPVELLERLPLWSSSDYVPLPPTMTPPPSDIPVSLPFCEATTSSMELAHRVVTELDIVLDDPRPVLIGVGDQQVVAVLQDIVHPPDILLQALQAAQVPLTPDSHRDSSETDSQTSSEDESDTWALAADRILRWLQDHPVADEPDSQDEDAVDDDDSRAPNLFQPALAVITNPSSRIYLREAMAWLLAALLAPPATVIHTDNLALRQAITSGHIHALPWQLCMTFSYLAIKKRLRARWVSTKLNPADMPSRLPRTFRPFASAIG
ncbi:hypothetical protein HPB47_016264 [Ixodes persulcatus]|uniref:Uncharacterized protein n=1 Tax=Ixodes persulcatus TaxID=34615 RepID=A0AC60QRD2_IXOPE|nr:hypothetical protein HPB47_016264 [Ixodes persulcatus]